MIDRSKKFPRLKPAGHTDPSAGRQPMAEDRLRDLQRFGANPGALRARTYVPAALPRGAALVVVLHGCTQTAAGYDHGAGWSRLADEASFVLLFPEQCQANNPNLCFNWFEPESTRRGQGEVASIRQMIDRMLVDHPIDPHRVYVTGLSAGGAMTMALLASYPDTFAGGAVIAGLPAGTATTMPQAFQRMRGQETRDGEALAALVRSASDHEGTWPTLSVWHGDADATVSPGNARLIVAQWCALHGLADAPGLTDLLDGHVRRVWLGPDGRELVEQVTIAGMGHGTPLCSGGAQPCGNPGPYMLEAGISSTRHIARFWGLLPANLRSQADTADNVGIRPKTALAWLPVVTPEQEPAPHTAAPSQRVPSDRAAYIQNTIDSALRAAGLLR